MTSLRRAVYVVDPVIIALLGVSVLAARPHAAAPEATPVRLEQQAPDAVGRTDTDTPTLTLSTMRCPASIRLEDQPLTLDDIAGAFAGAAPSRVTIRTDSVTAALINRLRHAGVSHVGLTYDEQVGADAASSVPRGTGVPRETGGS
jgi:hypothetical protein